MDVPFPDIIDHLGPDLDELTDDQLLAKMVPVTRNENQGMFRKLKDSLLSTA